MSLPFDAIQPLKLLNDLLRLIYETISRTKLGDAAKAPAAFQQFDPTFGKPGFGPMRPARQV